MGYTFVTHEKPKIKCNDFASHLLLHIIQVTSDENINVRKQILFGDEHTNSGRCASHLTVVNSRLFMHQM